MKYAWAQYHLIGDAMRGDVYLAHNFSTRVLLALDADPVVTAHMANVVPIKAARKLAVYETPKFWSIAASVAAVMFVGVMVLQQQLSSTDALSPVEIAQSVPTEYLAAHQAAAPSGAAYYIQNASYSNSQASQQ